MSRRRPGSRPAPAGRGSGPASRVFAKPSRRGWAAAALLAVLTAIAYVPALSGGFVWDDDLWVETNPLLTAPDGLWKIWFSTEQPSQYFPLVYTTFRIEHALWGLDPTGYHATNILLHVAGALLAWRVLAVLSVPGSWAAAALFALHPVHVESVAWITERKNVLMLPLFLLALLAWIAFVRRTEGPGRSAPGWYALSLIFAVLALTAKTTACTLPAAMAIAVWLDRRPLTARRCLQMAPHAALGLAFGLITMLWERMRAGTRPEVIWLDPVERMLVAGRAVWFYLWKLAWPADLAFSYPKWRIDAADPVQYLWPVAAVALAAALWLARGRIGRGPVAAYGFFVATLSPMLGVIMLLTFVYTWVADHYQYVASLGPIALAAAGGALAANRFGRAGRLAATTALAVVLATFGALTWSQCRAYESPETLWRDTLRKNPESFMAHNNLANLLKARGRVEESIPHYEAALRAGAADAGSYPGKMARIHYNLGNAHARLNRFEAAIASYRVAVTIEPDHALAWNNLGNSLTALGRVDGAIAAYEKALAADPRSARAHFNLAVALRRAGRLREAAGHFEEAFRLDPSLRDGRQSPPAHGGG